MKSKETTYQGKIISIKTKLLGIILPVVICIMILLVGISYYISKDIITEYSYNLLNSSVENQASSIEAWLQENLSAFNIIKQTIEGTDPDEEQIQNMLEQYYGFDDNYPDGIYVVDESGKLLSAKESAKKGMRVTDSIWCKDALTRVNMAFTNAYTNEKGESVISACGMLKSDSDNVRVISAEMSLQRISLIVNTFSGMEKTQAFLVDSEDDTILAHRDSSLISLKLRDINDPFMQGVADRIETWDYSMAEISSNMTAFAEIEGTDWILVSYVPSATIYKEIDSFRNIISMIAIVSLIVLTILIERVVHVTIRPVKELTKVIRTMTDGDFTVSVKSRSKDEIGIMSKCLERFIISMREMIASIYGVSGKLQEQADSSKDVSEQMYDASRLQSQSMQQLNATVAQLSVSVSEIAQNASTLASVVADTREDGLKVDDKVRETVEVSQKGKSDMQNVGQAMNDINDAVVKLQHAIDKVGKSSEEIMNITSVIGSIAEETNLLSLNASIEAARAGEAGKGFAVVATEIGHLAQTSTESVKNIDQLISEINVLVKDAVGQAADSVKNISNSSSLVENALVTFDAIFQNIDTMSNLVSQMLQKVERVDEVAGNVAAISQEQAASSEEILASSDTMVEQADHITGNSESVASGARELTSSAEELSSQVEIFRIC